DLITIVNYCRSTGDVVDVDVGVRSDQLVQVHELMRAERIRIDAAPARVDAPRALVARPDAVAPVVLIGEASAGPTQHGDFERLERFEDVVADSPSVRDRRILSDPDAVVDQSTEMLRKMTVDMRMNLRLRLIRSYEDVRRAGTLCRSSGGNKNQQRGTQPLQCRA